MSMTLQSSDRIVTLPKYEREGLKELITQNFAKNYALSGRLYVDYYNIRSGWKVSFPAITRAEYAEIRQIFDDQFTNEEFLIMDDPDIPVDGVRVFLNLPSERNLSWNKEAVTGLTITLEPEDANS